VSADSIFDVGLAALVLAVAAWTIAARESFAAIVGFVCYGLLLSLAFVRLSAVDVALTEAAIGGGVTGVLLIGACARLRPSESSALAGRPGGALRLAAALGATAVSLALAAAVLRLAEPAPTLAPAAAASLPATGLGNPVTGVLLAYRAVDTLLEKVVIVLALIGVWSLAPDRLFGGRPGPPRRASRDAPLAFLAQMLPPVGILIGVHLLWVGADAPGGAFPGATMLAAMWILAVLAGRSDAPPVARRAPRWLVVAGPLFFFAVGIAGVAAFDGFLAYPEDHAKALIIAIEVPLTLSVAAALGLLFAGPSGRAPEP
jgi:multisubunit Na+/H+ antiporter MnhB subunit